MEDWLTIAPQPFLSGLKTTRKSCRRGSRMSRCEADDAGVVHRTAYAHEILTTSELISAPQAGPPTAG